MHSREDEGCRKRSRSARECASAHSRPAVSHHLQILKEAGILGMRKEGTKNFYYFDSDQESMKMLAEALEEAVSIAAGLPDREMEE